MGESLMEREVMLMHDAESASGTRLCNQVKL